MKGLKFKNVGANTRVRPMTIAIVLAIGLAMFSCGSGSGNSKG